MTLPAKTNINRGIDFHVLAKMPLIHFHPSLSCNLSCSYCTQVDRRDASTQHNLIDEKSVIDFFEQIPPTHVYMSGGEPLIQPGIAPFLKRITGMGHMVSFDTNLSVRIGDLEKIVRSINIEQIGFFNISHHLVCKVGMQYLLERIRILKDGDVPHFVKYIGIPEHLPEVAENMYALKAQGVGVALSLLFSENWKGKRYPADYTMEEIKTLLSLMTTYTHGLQVFEGLYSQGLACRGGQDFIAWNMLADNEILPCCHGFSHPLDIRETFFYTGKKERIPCNIEKCLGDLMFLLGINGVRSEIDRFDALCRGQSRFLGAKAILNYMYELIGEGYRVVNEKKMKCFASYLDDDS